MPRRKKTGTHKKITGATGKGKSTYLRSLVESMKSIVGLGKMDEPPKLEKTLRKIDAELQKTPKKPRKQKR